MACEAMRAESDVSARGTAGAPATRRQRTTGNHGGQKPVGLHALLGEHGLDLELGELGAFGGSEAESGLQLAPGRALDLGDSARRTAPATTANHSTTAPKRM